MKHLHGLCLAAALLPAALRADTGAVAAVTADYRQLGYEEDRFTLHGQPFSGLAVQTNRAGRVVARRHFQDGRYDGRTEEFHTNGVMSACTDFLAGQRHGTNLYWNADGSLLKRQRWEHGRLVESTHPEDMP
jgi:antitoxin component YwqK of YwqJK toxin-antitoxin module